MTSLISWDRFARLGPFRWSALQPWRAGRIALGIALPLAAGWFAGHIEYGAYMALGALPAGFASLQGETRSRVAVIAVAAAGMAISTFVGATTAAGMPWLLPMIVAVWAYLSGLSVCLGPAAGVAVLQWSVALLIAVGLPLGPGEAALRAALVLAGGALQAVLVAGSWTLRRGATERAALAASYRALAEYGYRLATAISTPPPATALPAGGVLDDPNPLLGDNERRLYLDLLEQAERVRASLAALAVYSIDDANFLALLYEASSTLGGIADALADTRAEGRARIDQIGPRVAGFTIDERAPWRWSAEALQAELRAVVHMLQALDSSGRGASSLTCPVRPLAPKEQGWLAGAAARLWANASMQTEAGRHALRLAIVAALAEAFVQATRLYQGRWVVLTILIVLKPDYSSTLYRGVHRALGTALGAVLAAFIAHQLHAYEGWLILASAMAAAAAFALFEVSYFLFSMPLTAFILLLLVLIGMPGMANAEARAIDTFIGAALALAAYIAWPTWLGATAEQKFADLVDAHRDYATALLREFADSGSVGAARLRALQAAARRARSDAEAGAARLADEPPHPPLTPDFAQLLIVGVARLAHAELALHALVLSERAGQPRGDIARDLGELTTALTSVMTSIADALRTLQVPQATPPMRPVYAHLVLAAGVQSNPLIDIAAHLVDATDALLDTLRARLPTYSKLVEA